MCKKIIIGIIINFAFLSCTLEQSLGVIDEAVSCPGCPVDPTNNVWEYNVVTLDEFVWKQEITKTFNKNFETVLLRDEHVVYSDDGYTNINKESGAKLWDNEVGFRDYGPPVRQVVTRNHIYHNYNGTLEQIDIQNGVVELEYRWSDFQEGRLESPMLVHEGVFYGLISTGELESKKLKWAACPVDQLSSNNWTFYEDIFSDSVLNSTDISNPEMSKNNLGEPLLIYSKNIVNIGSTNYFSIVAYNLEDNKIEWEVRETHQSLDGERVIVDGDKVYYYFAYHLTCLDAATGSAVWLNLYNTTININEFASLGEYLFVYDFNANIQVIKKETGEKVLVKNFKNVIPSAYTGGYHNNTAQLHNNQLYYMNSIGSLMRVDIKNGDHQRYHLPETEDGLSGPSFYDNGMVISDDGIIYTSDGFHHLAFPAPVD